MRNILMTTAALMLVASVAHATNNNPTAFGGKGGDGGNALAGAAAVANAKSTGIGISWVTAEQKQQMNMANWLKLGQNSELTNGGNQAVGNVDVDASTDIPKFQFIAGTGGYGAASAGQPYGRTADYGVNQNTGFNAGGFIAFHTDHWKEIPDAAAAANAEYIAAVYSMPEGSKAQKGAILAACLADKLSEIMKVLEGNVCAELSANKPAEPVRLVGE